MVDPVAITIQPNINSWHPGMPTEIAAVWMDMLDSASPIHGFQKRKLWLLGGIVTFISVKEKIEFDL